jgi:uncharacterized protein (TIGR02145 family)
MKTKYSNFFLFICIIFQFAILTVSPKLIAQNFKTIVVGNTIWMAENLTTDRFQNGDPIPFAPSFQEWIDESKHVVLHDQQIQRGYPAWCYYENKQENEKFGKLYNHIAVSDPRGLCPVGWKIPTDSDWNNLIEAFGGPEKAGFELKNWSSWQNNGSNSSGFKAMPGGIRGDNELGRGRYGEFEGLGNYGYWWSISSSTPSPCCANGFRLSDDKSAALIKNVKRKKGMSVRCIKNAN